MLGVLSVNTSMLSYWQLSLAPQASLNASQMLGVLSFILLYLIDVSISFVTLTTLNMTKLASNVILSEVEESQAK